MEAVWRHVLRSVASAPGVTGGEEAVMQRPLLLTEACFNTDLHRAKLFEVAFEGLGTRELHLAHQSVLPLYACGQVTGVVVDVGHDCGQPVPVHEGYAMDFAVPDVQYNVAGRHITDMMTKLLLERKFKVTWGLSL